MSVRLLVILSVVIVAVAVAVYMIYTPQHLSEPAPETAEQGETEPAEGEADTTGTQN